MKSFRQSPFVSIPDYIRLLRVGRCFPNLSKEMVRFKFQLKLVWEEASGKETSFSIHQLLFHLAVSQGTIAPPPLLFLIVCTRRTRLFHSPLDPVENTSTKRFSQQFLSAERSFPSLFRRILIKGFSRMRVRG